MAVKSSKVMDKYVNKMYIGITMSAANTLTFQEVTTGVEAFSKQAWVIHEIDYFLSNASLQLLLASDDYIQLALTSHNQMTSLGLGNAGVVDLWQINGAHASWESPIVRDFSNLPGGGLIIAPRPLYLAETSASIASAASGQARILFTVLPELSGEDYLDLVDYYRIIQ